MVPGDTPNTPPFSEPIVAIPVRLLLHVPPLSPSLNVVDNPEHTVLPPVIVGGVGLICIVVEARHPPVTT